MSEEIESIKKTVSFFLEIEADKIGVDTVIDNSVLQGSVKIHIMYGELSDNGFKVSNYTNIKTFGELLSLLNLGSAVNSSLSNETENKIAQKTVKSTSNVGRSLLNLGVDILSVQKMPQVSDFRESSFYTDNFSAQEISYCITKRDAYKSFAGKFAAKEAIVKANNQYKNRRFSNIEVLNDADGRPYFEELSISISHEEELVIAIASSESKANNNNVLAIENKLNKDISQEKISKTESGKKKTNFNKWLTLSLVLNAAIVVYIIYNHFFN